MRWRRCGQQSALTAVNYHREYFVAEAHWKFMSFPSLCTVCRYWCVLRKMLAISTLPKIFQYKFLKNVWKKNTPNKQTHTHTLIYMSKKSQRKYSNRWSLTKEITVTLKTNVKDCGFYILTLCFLRITVYYTIFKKIFSCLDIAFRPFIGAVEHNRLSVEAAL